jgi:Fe-S-cluster containining protein
VSSERERRAARQWLEVAGDHPAAAALEAVYARAAQQIEARGPACWASGRCCRFARAGHRLYVTGLEAAYCVLRAPACGPAGASGLRLAVAGAGEDCPFLDGPARTRCGVHPVKPLGCRLYFCDRAAQDWQRRLHEDLLREVRAIHDAHAIPYLYAEWRGLLALVAGVAGATPGGEERSSA